MAPPRKCPVCGRAAAPRAANPTFPFCSDRCRLIDLGKWLGEEYRIPAGRPGDGAVTGVGPMPNSEEDP